MASEWHKLPFEVLTYIFEHSADGDRGSQFRRRDFYNYQLVCKGWSKAAQSLLYRRISFEHIRVEDELQRFVQFIYTIKVLAPQVGSFVKAITVCKGLDRLEEPLTALDAIFNTCTKLEEFYCAGSSKEVAWPYMLTLSDARLSSLRIIVNEKEQRNYSPLYPFLAFKLKRSLSQLHYVKIQQVPSWESKYLLDNLSQFVSLQQLFLLQCVLDSSDALSKVIDACSPTVSKLYIHQYLPLSTMEASIHNKANPNLGIKEITIDRGIMDSIVYFADKFKNLQKLNMNQVAPLDMAADTTTWIRGLTDLCCSLKEYELRFNLELEGNIKDPCIDLIKRSASLPRNTTTTYFIIDYVAEPDFDPLDDGDDSMANPIWGMTIKKDGTRCGIEVSLPCNEHGEEDDIDSAFDYHMHWLDNYSPNHIEIRRIEAVDYLMKEWEDQRLSIARTWNDFVTNFIHLNRDPLVEARRWMILTKTLFSTVDAMDAVVSLSGLVIPNCNGRTTHLEKSSSPHVKHFTLKNAIIHEDLFPVISSWLPKLDTLTLTTCFVLTEEPFALKIDLPDTKLQHLEIIAGPVYLGECLSESANVGKHLFRNADLVKALSPGRQCTLRLDINGESSISTLRDNTRSPPMKFQKDADYHGTSDNFCIWIRCRELKDISILGGKDDFEANDDHELKYYIVVP